MESGEEESEVLRGLFEEIMKMLVQRQVKVETIVQRSIEQGIVTRDSFERMQKMLDEYAKKRQWSGQDSGQLAPHE